MKVKALDPRLRGDDELISVTLVGPSRQPGDDAGLQQQSRLLHYRR